jgi:hypothetical protein
MPPMELPLKTLMEIFGHAPDDSSKDARLLWEMGMCPFTQTSCTKINHNSGIIYGTCSASTKSKSVIICPNRLYANSYECIKAVSQEAFGSHPFLMFGEYWKKREELGDDKVVIALGQNSGREVKLGTSLSMDWILAVVKGKRLVEYLGIEVQSIDITNNYRDNWHYFKNQDYLNGRKVPPSEHGYNWANVHKRLIPQLIRKGVIYADSKLVNHGLFFILPESVYQKFEDVVGKLGPSDGLPKNTMTVLTYDLGPVSPNAPIRPLQRVRTVNFLVKDFANAFIAGASLPSGETLDRCVKTVLNLL